MGLLRNGFNRRESETCFVKEEKRAEDAEGWVIHASEFEGAEIAAQLVSGLLHNGFGLPRRSKESEIYFVKEASQRLYRKLSEVDFVNLMLHRNHSILFDLRSNFVLT